MKASKIIELTSNKVVFKIPGFNTMTCEFYLLELDINRLSRLSIHELKEITHQMVLSEPVLDISVYKDELIAALVRYILEH